MNHVLCGLAANPALPSEAVDRLITTADEDVSATLPPEVREILAADTDIRVVVELALWTTPDTAARLAAHPHAEVRRAVACNQATPPRCWPR